METESKDRYDTLRQTILAYIHSTGHEYFLLRLDEEDAMLQTQPQPSKQFLESAIARMQTMLTGRAS
jgi:hypothetical protein